MIGMFALPFLLASVQVAGLLGLGIGVFGSGIPIGGLLMSIPILLLTTATFAAVGVAIGGMMLLVKRGDPISGPFYQASMLLSGVIVPVDLLPGAIQVISWMLPATWGIRAVRELLLSDAGWHDVAPETLVLVAFTVVMLPSAVLAYRWCLRAAVRTGVLGSY
jgi:ABC-2 type transport system permease protein